jgi:hypothetical protein
MKPKHSLEAPQGALLNRIKLHVTQPKIINISVDPHPITKQEFGLLVSITRTVACGIMYDPTKINEIQDLSCRYTYTQLLSSP